MRHLLPCLTNNFIMVTYSYVKSCKSKLQYDKTSWTLIFSKMVNYVHRIFTRKLVVGLGLQQIAVDYNIGASNCLVSNPLYSPPKRPCVARCYEANLTEYSPADANMLRNKIYTESVSQSVCLLIRMPLYSYTPL